MLVSVFSAFNITASAENRNIYYKNTNGYNVVYAYAWDTTNNNAQKLDVWSGTPMERLGTSDYYKISVDSSANMIIFSNGSNSDKTADLEIPSYNNPMYSGIWESDFDESQYTISSNNVRAVNGKVDAIAPHTFGDNIYAASATYFDYMSDDEMTGSYLYPTKAGTGHNGADDNWYPFYRFNRAIKVAAENNANWQYPLYLGNFCNVPGANDGIKAHNGDFWNATDSYNVSRFDYVANNSNRKYVDRYGNVKEIGINDYNEAVQGLVSNQLKNNELMVTPTLKLPYFDIDFLTQKYGLEDGKLNSTNAKRIAKVYQSYFPFVEQKEKDNKGRTYSKYRFDSTGGTDNVYFTWNGENPKTVNYGHGTNYAVQDGLSHFMYQTASGYGIFPFNNGPWTDKKDRKGNDNLDYGFGIRIDIDFRVTGTGTIDGTENGEPITFNFSGDDDIWVYITDDYGNSNLVLDLGGNHKMASGDINFNTMKATVKRVYDRSNSGSIHNKQIQFNNGDKLNPNKTYHMTVFYMERGLIESNFQMNFSFYPLDNIFTTEKFVETAYVNNGIKDEVAKVDEFTITNKANNAVVANKEYTLDGEKYNTLGDGSYKIKDGQTASFNNIAKTGSTLNVTESTAGSVYDYTTRFTVTDVENNQQVASGNTLTTGDFLFQNRKSANDMTNFNVAFYNTPKTSNISLTKKVEKDGTEISSNMDFPFTILLDLDGDGNKYNYAPYPLEYKLSGNSATTYVTTSTGEFTLQSNQKAVFTGIPVNAKYRIIETADRDLYFSDKENDMVEGTVLATASHNDITFTNTMINNDPTVVQLQAEKLLDGESNFKEIFNFKLQEINAQGDMIGTAQTVNNSNGNTIQFPSIAIKKVDTGNYITLKDMYVYTTRPSLGTKMTKITDGIYEITFNNLLSGGYSYRFTANGSNDHTWDLTGAFNGTNNISIPVAKNNSTIKLRIDVSEFNFNKNSGSVTVSYTVTPPTTISNSVYLNNTKGWSTPHIYYWSDSNKSMVGWPGKPMQSIGNSIYKYDIPEDAQYVIFNVGSSSEQTSDLTVEFGHIYDNKTGVWSEYTQPAEVVEYSKTTNNLPSSSDVYTYKRYFEISEVIGSCNIENKDLSVDSEGNIDKNSLSYIYDETKYYAVVTVNQYATGIQTNVEYYKVLNTSPLSYKKVSENDVTFRNYHKGRLTVLKEDMNGNPINDGVTFSLYKVSGDGADIEGLEPIEKTVSNGKAVFENLDIFVGQDKHDTSRLQWYCVVESEPKDGYVINTSKRYFVIPEVTPSKTSEYDTIIDEKMYNYVLKNGEKIYDIEYTVVNAPVVVPKASGSGTAKYVYTGIAVMALALAMAGVYVGINSYKRRKCKVQ
ncbi:MAG: starch-binding protein [Acutalibacteraceae bacterium]|nr:starch-binding protein [Acutalibacteraceae bacterium]